jgi:hypothetical protein
VTRAPHSLHGTRLPGATRLLWWPHYSPTVGRMAIEDLLWALAESIKAGMVNPNANPAFTRYIDGNAALPETGFCVAYAETQNQFDRPGLNFAVEHARGHDRIVGGWLSKGKFYFDSVRIYHDHAAAENAARKNGQIGIYDLSKKAYTDIMEEGGGVAGSPGTFAPHARGRALSI